VEFRVPFRVDGGKVHTDGTVLTSPVIRFEAVGDAHLVSEALDLRIVPKWVHADRASTSDILVPLLVQGNFSEPQFRLDVKSAAKQEIRKQIQEKVIDSGELDKAFEKNEQLKPLEETTKGLLKNFFNKE
jgi:AsmA protein